MYLKNWSWKVNCSEGVIAPPLIQTSHPPLLSAPDGNPGVTFVAVSSSRQTRSQTRRLREHRGERDVPHLQPCGRTFSDAGSGRAGQPHVKVFLFPRESRESAPSSARTRVGARVR